MVNRLAQSPSLYLRKHAHNPIDWWPWCDEGLATARREDKPIFLSVGYSSCHWCTVMEGEAFSDSAIATYLNANFLPIKVDREERPDLDSIYMQALQMLVGQGGWPLNIFLSPDDLVPFYGGTYFPVEPRYGRPGFLQLLQLLRNLYDTDKPKVGAVKSQILETLQQSTLLPADDNLSNELLIKGLTASAKILIPSGQGTSFPMIPYALSALRAVRLVEPTDTLNPEQICLRRGLDLALGGIYDHVAGGFHRYTVDPTWTVPHFEKMLYDNGLIMEYLAELWSQGHQEPAFERAIAGTVQWLKREMWAGYFYAAQDADSFTTPDEAEPEEGAFYVWREAELRELLSDSEFSDLSNDFLISVDGNFEGNIVLQRRQPGQLQPETESALKKLFAVRYGQPELDTFAPAVDAEAAKNTAWPGRIPPVTDTKMIVAWNSLMISGLARAAAVLGQADYLDLATQAATFILDNQWVNGRFHRLNYNGTPAVVAQSEDYALFIKALLDIQQASLAFVDSADTSIDWLTQATKIQAEFDQWLWSDAASGYYNTASDASDSLLIRERSYQDSATPAANGVAIANLLRLVLLTENLAYLDRAEHALKSFSVVMEQATRACPTLLQSLDWYRHHTLVQTSAAHVASLLPQYLPTGVISARADLPDQIVGLVCQGVTCQEPAATYDQLIEQLGASQQRA
ncbi:thioredoxin domain-containing protein [Leptolyngbya cf. ectocarpi LEGE 11479]|uniref:Thioredoxin domain-containing protein n=1 Tax=Leptolyngbya cf. ectocarpi LEGE 11479 TaxID=1828722 RepID=A0A928ZPL6_LEPEC|nr:thioredoxin domain-containing protein [Leptolyngbya ectocarpi]MBE9065335.1 thioredoxin domain-containing protein [Leptolyngbya cf. ectocarpi LEGE 11479]